MPRDAESDDGTATDLLFAFFVLIPTARQAPNCAKFAADAIGIQIFRLLNSALESMPASITLYI